MSCLFLELIGSTSINLQFGQLPCNPVKNVTYIYLACTEYRLVPYSPACDLRTLSLTYTTPQSSLHSVPLTDISLFCNGNNPGKPFCTALLSFFPAYLGYDRKVHNHTCVLACNDPLLNRCR